MNTGVAANIHPDQLPKNLPRKRIRADIKIVRKESNKQEKGKVIGGKMVELANADAKAIAKSRLDAGGSQAQQIKDRILGLNKDEIKTYLDALKPSIIAHIAAGDMPGRDVDARKKAVQSYASKICSYYRTAHKAFTASNTKFKEVAAKNEGLERFMTDCRKVIGKPPAKKKSERTPKMSDKMIDDVLSRIAGTPTQFLEKIATKIAAEIQARDTALTFLEAAQAKETKTL